MSKKYTEDNYKEWEDLYNEGKNYVEIGASFNADPSYIRKVLIQKGVATRNPVRFTEEDFLMWERLYQDGRSFDAVGKEYEVSGGYVRKILKKRGVEARSKSSFSEEDFNRWVALYNEGVSIKDSALEYKSDFRTIKKKIEPHVKIRVNGAKISKEEKEEWIDLYQYGFSINEIGKLYDISRQVVTIFLNSNDVDTSRGINMTADLIREWEEKHLGGWSIHKIAVTYGCDSSTVKSYFDKNNIEYTLREAIVPDPPTEEELKRWEQMYSERVSADKIAEIEGVDRKRIRYFLNKMGVELRTSNEAKLSKPHLLNAEPSYIQKQVIIGSLLGDGCADTRGRLIIGHSEKQVEWLEQKRDWLGELVYDNGIKRSVKNGYKIGSIKYTLNTVPNQFIKKLRAESYLSTGGRDISSLIPHVDALALAVLFGDDGHYMNRGRGSGGISTYGFSEEQNALLAEHLHTKLNIDCKVSRHKKVFEDKGKKFYYGIYIRSSGMQVMRELIAPYLPNSMKYKIGLNR
ncbi:hypothetical protein [Priestia sp. JSM ZJ58]|uniref:hypothetical protein n=1 Tax=Priestia sp. JSM ZJ58 TaxID=3376189 RepID=UPI0037ABE1FE